MEKIIVLMGKRFVPTLGAVLLTGITLVTSVAGVMKVSNTISSVKPNVIEIKTLEEIALTPTLTPTKKPEQNIGNINNSTDTKILKTEITISPDDTTAVGGSVNKGDDEEENEIEDNDDRERMEKDIQQIKKDKENDNIKS